MIDERGLAPVKKFLEELGGWPVTYSNGQEWNESKFSFIQLLVKLKLYNNKIFVDQWVSADDKNSDVNIIQVRRYPIFFDSSVATEIRTPCKCTMEKTVYCQFVYFEVIC
jgi:hypothetical protein